MSMRFRGKHPSQPQAGDANTKRTSSDAPPNQYLSPHKTATRNSWMLALSLTLLVVICCVPFRFLFAASSSRSGDHPRISLLDVYSSALAKFPPCTAHRISLDSTSSAKPDDEKPTIYTGWNVPADGTIANMYKFVDTYGHHPQMVKDGDALPLFDSDRKFCTVTTKTLVETMAHRFGNGVEADNPESPRTTKDDLLFFTNNSECPSLFRSLRSEYSAPGPIHGSSWPKIFSVLMRGSSHRFHMHDETWLGQIAGSRLWFLAPPSTNKGLREPPVPACDYLSGRAALPDVEGIMACVQRPGEVMYFPPYWYHATCGLEEWNVGVGEQKGAPSFGELVVDLSMSEGERREKLIECGALKQSSVERARG
ncbi:hypothetical protein ACHAWF_016228 [Thalassiosira exigua]